MRHRDATPGGLRPLPAAQGRPWARRAGPVGRVRAPVPSAAGGAPTMRRGCRDAMRDGRAMICHAFVLSMRPMAAHPQCGCMTHVMPSSSNSNIFVIFLPYSVRQPRIGAGTLGGRAVVPGCVRSSTEGAVIAASVPNHTRGVDCMQKVPMFRRRIRSPGIGIGVEREPHIYKSLGRIPNHG